MTLIAPLNDVDCLKRLHAEAQRYAALPVGKAMARRFTSKRQLVNHIRRLAQRDDLGDPSDGPRLACEISQRARFAPSEPNCFERSLLYLALAEILDPHTERTSASMIVGEGWHTFPVEMRNGLPVIVVLDPQGPPRNAALSTAYDTRNVAVTRPDVTVPWFIDMARNACLDAYAGDCFDRAIGSLRNSVLTAEPLDRADDIEQVMSWAEGDAWLWGPQGQAAIARVDRSIRNLSFDLDTGRVGRFLRKIAGASEQLGREIGPKALRAALVAEFGPAAALALDGVNVAVQSGKAAQAAESPRPADGQQADASQPGASADDAATSTDPSAEAGNGAPPSKSPKPRTNVQNLRRMTFAFRTPRADDTAEHDSATQAPEATNADSEQPSNIQNMRRMSFGFRTQRQ